MKRFVFSPVLLFALVACYLPSAPPLPVTPLDTRIDVTLELSMMLDARPITSALEVGERVQATVILSNLTDQPMYLDGEYGWFFHISALEVDDATDSRDPKRNELGSRTRANTLLLTQPPFYSSRGPGLSLYLEPRQSLRVPLEVWFDQPGAFLVRGAVRFQTSRSEFIVQSPPLLVRVR